MRKKQKMVVGLMTLLVCAFVPETATHQDWKLKNIGWNDKISSLVFRIITVQNITNGTYTPHDPV